MARSFEKKNSFQTSSSNEPTARSPYFIFLSALLIAAIAGVAFRLYASPERVSLLLRQALDRALQKQSVHISFSNAQILLARGSLPDLALEVRDVEVRTKDICDAHKAALQIERIRIPVRFLALLQGQILPGRASGRVLAIPLSTINHDCSTTTQATQLARLEVRDFTIAVDPPFQSAQVKGSLIIPSVLVQNEPVPPLKLLAHIAQDSVSVDLQGHLNEGSILAKGSYQAHDPKHDGAPYIDVDFETRSLPISALASYLQKAKIIQDRFQPHFIWLNCHAKMAGRAERFVQETALHIQNCGLTGEAGDLSLQNAVLEPSGNWQPFHIDIKNLNVRKVLDTFSLEGPSGVISDFGFLNGQLMVEGPRRVQAVAELSQVRVGFMNREMSESQLFSKIALKLDFHGDRVQGAIPEIIIQDGKFLGGITMDFDSHFRDGDVKVSIDQLKFAPAVENLMLDGTVGQMGVRGTARFHEGRIANWKGNAFARKLVTSAVQIPNLDAQMDYKNGVFSAQAEAHELTIAEDWFWFQFAKPVFLGETPVSNLDATSGNWLKLQGSRAHLEVQDGEVRWDKAHAALPETNFAIESSGVRSKNQKLSGTLDAQIGAGRRVTRLQWQLQGSSNQPILVAVSPEIQEILKRMDQASGLAASEPTMPSRLKIFGRKMLDRAEQIMRFQRGDGTQPTLSSAKASSASQLPNEGAAPESAKSAAPEEHSAVGSPVGEAAPAAESGKN